MLPIKKILITTSAVALGVSVMPAPAHEHEGHGRATEEKVTMEQLPSAVQASLLKEAEGGTFQEIEKITRKQTATYEASFTINNKKYEAEIAEDGTLLVKKLDNEEGEDDDSDRDND